MKVINDDDEIFPPRNIELTNIFRTLKWPCAGSGATDAQMATRRQTGGHERCLLPNPAGVRGAFGGGFGGGDGLFRRGFDGRNGVNVFCRVSLLVSFGHVAQVVR